MCFPVVFMSEASQYPSKEHLVQAVKALVKTETILKYFVLGSGCTITGKAVMLPSTVESPTEESKQEFQTKLINQIKRLIGHDPRLVHNENGLYAVYYS